MTNTLCQNRQNCHYPLQSPVGSSGPVSEWQGSTQVASGTRVLRDHGSNLNGCIIYLKHTRGNKKEEF